MLLPISSFLPTKKAGYDTDSVDYNNKAGRYQIDSDLPFVLRLMRLAACELRLRGKRLKVSG